jgi:hypothetical protein
MFITAVPILINLSFIVLSGIYAVGSVLSQMQPDGFDNNPLTQALEIMIGAIIALVFQIPQFVEAYMYSAYIQVYIGP